MVSREGRINPGEPKAMPTKAILTGLLFFVLAAGPSHAQAQQPQSLTDPAYKNGVLQKIAELLESRYVLSDIAKGFADEFRTKCASGAYGSSTEVKDFAVKVTADLIAITHDKHMNLRVIESSDVGEKAVSPLHHPVRYARLREKENTGLTRLEMVEPGIGVLELRRFYSFDQAKDMILAAMTFLAGANAIIIDVRENGGGSGDYLSSYFLPYPTQLCGLYTRRGNTLTETWTRRDIGTEPRTDVPVFIVTGPRTFSAAEYFAFDMQSRKRATLVGEPTKGGAHDIDLFRIDDQFELSISTGRAVSPVTGGNWEGTGVIPDVPTAPAAAMDQALRLARKAAEMYGRVKEEKLRKAVGEMQADLERTEKAFREGRRDDANASLDSLFRVARSAGVLTEFFIDVFAYEYRSGENEAMLFAIITKATELFPRSPAAHLRLAGTANDFGKKDLALSYARKTLELDPENRIAARMIKDLQK